MKSEDVKPGQTYRYNNKHDPEWDGHLVYIKGPSNRIFYEFSAAFVTGSGEFINAGFNVLVNGYELTEVAKTHMAPTKQTWEFYRGSVEEHPFDGMKCTIIYDWEFDGKTLAHIIQFENGALFTAVPSELFDAWAES